jgi:FkbM family methyltransferase
MGKLENKIIMFYSQAGQDQWVIDVSKNKSGGYFLDLGAYDGVNYSNSFYLEKNLDWSGICVEADPKNFKNLIKNRNCICENIAVNNYKGLVNFSSSEMGGKIDDESLQVIECETIENILIKNNAPFYIDYLSIDIEGNEFKVLEFFPFNTWKFGIITVEHNLYCDGDFNKNRIMDVLLKNGYVIERENVSHEGLPFEDWYLLKQ